MWKTIEADGYPDAGTECFVWRDGMPKAKIAEAFASGDARGFSNAGGDVDATHWILLGYPPLPTTEPAAKPARRSKA